MMGMTVQNGKYVTAADDFSEIIIIDGYRHVKLIFNQMMVSDHYRRCFPVLKALS